MNLKNIVVCCLFAHGAILSAPQEPETFLAQPSSRKQKKKKSLSTLRQEFVEGCEAYAHSIIREIFVISSLMNKRGASRRDELLSIMQRRYASVSKAEKFFATGAYHDCKDKVKVELSMQDEAAAWKLMGMYAQLQEQLLYAITDIVEQIATSPFMTSDKQQLQKYQEQLLFLQEESELLVKELQATSNQATLKK